MNSKDKRRGARRRHESALEIFDASGQFITGTGRLIDVSTVGVCFSSNKKLAPGEPDRARFGLLNGEVVEVASHVVWARRKPHDTLYGLACDAAQNFQV